MRRLLTLLVLLLVPSFARAQLNQAYSPLVNGGGLSIMSQIDQRMNGTQRTATKPLTYDFAHLPVEADGNQIYCVDCTQATPTAGGGAGAYLLGVKGAWSGTAGVGAPPAFTLALLPSPTINDTRYFCSDCIQNSTPCTSGGTGAPAVVVNGLWSCSGGNPYDIAFPFGTGLPGANQAVTIPLPHAVLWSANFSPAYAACDVNPTANTTFLIKKNGTQIGTVVLSTGCVPTSTSTGGVPQAGSINDKIAIVAPSSPDATLANPVIVLTGSEQ